MTGQIDSEINHKESRNIMPETRSIKMRIWIAACIIFFAAGVVFLIIFWNQAKYDYPILHYKWIIIYSAIAVILISVWCFFKILTKITVVNFVFLVTAGIVLAAGWYIYFRYIPKYFLIDACAIVKADPKYASAIVIPGYNDILYDEIYDENGDMHPTARYKIENNPFWEWGYILFVIKDEKVTARIAFDNVTGKYEVIYDTEEYEIQY